MCTKIEMQALHDICAAYDFYIASAPEHTIYASELLRVDYYVGDVINAGM